MRSKTPKDDPSVCNACPLTLLPSPFPRSAFLAAQTVQEDYNLLYHRAAHDYKFLNSALERSVQADDFLQRLWKIYESIRSEGAVQPLSLCLARSDYMVDTSSSGPTPQIKQVEMNTISSSMAGLAVAASHMHRYVLQLLGVKDPDEELPCIESNLALRVLATGLLHAWEAYTRGSDGAAADDRRSAAVLFLVGKTEANFADQRALQYEVHALDPRVTIVRATFDDVYDSLPLRCERERRLYVHGHEIAVVYMRHGYAPEHYPTEQEWEARLQIERSRAIKCPSVQLHLAGSKKVQQDLARPGRLERLLADDPAACARLRATFTGLYSLDQEDDGDGIMAVALKNPEKYVMKPQREGGGNNFYGDDIAVQWAAVRGTQDQSAYILMDRIFPMTTRNYRILPGKENAHSNGTAVDVISELGVYGAILGSADQVLWNSAGGYLLRTKPQNTNEGGVATGYSAIDTPCLV